MRLGEIIKPAKVERCGKRELPVLSMTMHDGIVLQANRFKKAIASKDQGSYKVVNPGQLVVGFPIDEGVLYVQGYDYEGIMSPAYSVWDIDTSLVEPQYLELALHSPQSMAFYKDKMRGTTARRRSLPAATLIELDIPVPSREKQIAVIDALLGIRGEIADSSKMNEFLRDLVKSRFVEMFGDPIENAKGWVKKPIGAVYEVGSAKRVYARDQVSAGVPFLRLGDLTNRIQLGVESCELFITEEMYEGHKAKGLVPDAGDILVTARGTMGLCYEVKPEDRFYFQDGMITWLHAKPDSPLPIFLTNLFANKHFGEDLHEHTSGTTVKYLSIKTLSQLPMVVPPLALQQEFAAFVQQVDKLEFETQQAINKLQMLYDSLAQEYFTVA